MQFFTRPNHTHYNIVNKSVEVEGQQNEWDTYVELPFEVHSTYTSYNVKGCIQKKVFLIVLSAKLC